MGFSPEGELRNLVSGGATFLEVVAHISSSVKPEKLTPLKLMWVIQEGLGISFTETRNVLEFFDSELRPIVDEALIDERGDRLLEQYRKRQSP
ncbi:hypothetical protein [Streptomyces sp. NPDC060198]|uniref:hypothetical protein n=1 Tax=Streptomyces sp. NPDC060198 TaxID=3347070 RepID=UPI00365B2BB6